MTSFSLEKLRSRLEVLFCLHIFPFSNHIFFQQVLQFLKLLLSKTSHSTTETTTTISQNKLKHNTKACRTKPNYRLHNQRTELIKDNRLANQQIHINFPILTKKITFQSLLKSAPQNSGPHFPKYHLLDRFAPLFDFISSAPKITNSGSIELKPSRHNVSCMAFAFRLPILAPHTNYIFSEKKRVPLCNDAYLPSK